MSKIIEAINRETPLAVVESSVEVLESMLKRVIKSGLPSKLLGLPHLSFGQLIDLAESLRLLPPGLDLRLYLIDGLREGLRSGNLPEITSGHVADLERTISGSARRALVGAGYAQLCPLGKFGGVVLLTKHEIQELIPTLVRRARKLAAI